MTVRTDKIQALTGSAPLTLPTSLPSSSKNIQVSTSGVLSTPDVANSLSNLTNAGNSGYVLLDHQEIDEDQNFVHLKMDGTDYTATDIYAFEVIFDAIMLNTGGNGSTQPVYISPMNGDTGIALGQSGGQYYVGKAEQYSRTSTWFDGTGNAQEYGNSGQLLDASGNTIGYEMQFSQVVVGTGWNSSYSKSFSDDPYYGSNNEGLEAAGFFGTFRYFNGFCGRGFNPDLDGFNPCTSTSVNDGIYQYKTHFTASTTSQGSYPSNMQNAADGFLIGTSSTSRSFQGNFMLFGIPKATT